MNKELFRAVVKERSWSNLLTNSEQEIEECLRLIDAQKELEKALLSIWVFTIEKKQKNID